MAISYIGGHNTDNFTPAFNQVNYYFDSTSKSFKGFRYVVDLYVSGTSTKIWEGRAVPRIGDGYGFVPLSAILSKKVSFENDITTDTLAASKSYFKFDLKIGEEYVYEWSYTNYSQYTGGGTFNGYTQLTSATAHGLLVGDQINVSQTDGGVIKPMLQGLFTIVAIPNTTTIVIDITWLLVGSGSTMGGKVSYADNRKTITRNLYTSTATVYNGALNAQDFLIGSNVFKIDGTIDSRRLLTSLPYTGMRLKLSELMFLNVGNFYTTAALYVWFQNDQGNTFRKSLNASTATAIMRASAGPGNLGALTTITGTAPLIKPTTKWYEVYIGASSAFPMSAKYRIEIDRRCTIEDVELLFVDRLGSILPFAFQLRKSIQVTAEKDRFNKQLGNLDGELNKWTYGLTDGGLTQISPTMEERLILRSNFITNEQSQLFKELLTSPFVVMKLNSVWQRVEVMDTSAELPETKNKRLIRKQIQVRFANQTPVNA